MQFNTTNQHFSSSYRLPLADTKGTHYFMPDEIIRLEANNVYTTLYFEGHPPFTVSKVLKIYEELLKPYGFVRTHRIHLVNRQYVRYITGDANHYAGSISSQSFPLQTLCVHAAIKDCRVRYRGRFLTGINGSCCSPIQLIPVFYWLILIRLQYRCM